MTKITDTLQQGVNVLYSLIPRKKPSFNKLKQVKIIAHRGCWDKNRLENTHEAFKASLNYNIWGLEFDIRWTQDNEAIVHHDSSAKRVFSNSLIIEQTSLKKLREKLPQIPTLKEMVQYYGKKRHLMIEIKTYPTEFQTKKLKETLEPLKEISDFHFMSLNLDYFTPLKEFDKKTFVSVARTNIQSIHSQTQSKELGGLTGQFLLLNQKMLNECHKQGQAVGTGFPTSKYALYREAYRGVDWVFTNHAIKLSQYLPHKVPQESL